MLPYIIGNLHPHLPLKMISKQTCFTATISPRLHPRLHPRFHPSSSPPPPLHTFRPAPHRPHATLPHPPPTAPLTDPISDPLSEPTPELPPTTFQVTPLESELRLDKLLATRFKSVSRTYLQALFTDNHILLNGNPPPSKSFKPSPDDQVTISFPPLARDLPITPENIPLDILYEDSHILAVNKPAGMVVHPAPANWTGTLVHALTYHYPDIRAMGGSRPGIVHRLDKGTSGVLIVARTELAQRNLMRLFAERKVKKNYVAVAVGNPCGDGCLARTVDEPIGRAIGDRLRMAVVPELAGGKNARSLIRVHASDDRGLLHAVSICLETGRTHQIRVHLRHCRAPVLGDDLYGAFDINKRFRTKAGRALLHAQRIEFEHPVSGEKVVVAVGLPEDMREIMGRVVYPGFEKEGW